MNEIIKVAIAAVMSFTLVNTGGIDKGTQTSEPKPVAVTQAPPKTTTPVDAIDTYAPERTAPFTKVKWREKGAPYIQINHHDKWYELLAIDDISGEKIAVYCRTAYGEDANKRFTEDLPSMVMPGLKHRLKRNVKLKLKEIHTDKIVVFPRVAMTTENRRILRNANNGQRDETPKFITVPHRYEAEAQYTRDGHVTVSLRVFKQTDPLQDKWDEAESMPKLTLRNGQRGTIKIGSDVSMFTIDAAKPISDEHVVTMMTIEHRGKLFSADAKNVPIKAYDKEAKD